MKLYNIAAFCVTLIASAFLASCVEDTTTVADKKINVVTFENMDDNITAVSHIDKIKIEPVLKGSVYGDDTSNYRYVWTLSNGNESLSSTTIKNQVISTEKDLEVAMDYPPGSYTFTLRVYDKTNGMEYEQGVTVSVVSPFVRGYYLMGEKEDALAGVDFVSFVAGRDTTIFKDVFKNDVGFKNPKDLFFLGYDALGSSDPFRMNLWLTSENDAVEIESSPLLDNFGVIKDSKVESKVYPTIPVKEPMHLVNVFPHAHPGYSNTSRSRYRALFTENEVYIGSFMSGPEIYGNPVNRYSAKSEELFKPFPFLFHFGNYASNPTSAVLYDLTNHTFCGPNAMYWYSGTYCNKPLSDVATATTFYWDQTKYNPVRDVVYGQNLSYGTANQSSSVALLADANGDYFVYQFKVKSYGFYSSYQPTKEGAWTIDMSKATDFAKATNYTFFGVQPYILYSVGSKLYVLNYAANKCEMVKDFGDEITYLAMDYASYNRFNEFRVCTYSKANKGIVYQYFIDDDVNNINIQKGDDEWHTDLKVKKFEYRNSSLGTRYYE